MSQDVITMSQKELQRLPVLQAILKKQTTQGEAAHCLDLSSRQVRRLQERLKQKGPEGLRHRSRGRRSNRAKSERLRQQVLGLIRDEYADFGPALACEQLAQRHKIYLSDETVRIWMRQEGLQAGCRRPRPHRRWRERSACLGQMVQMDGSHHDWLEGRGPKLVLMGYIDDATGRVYGRFYLSEDLAGALDSFKRYCRLYGIPQSVYLDKHTIYRSPKEPTVEEQLKGWVPQSQFERALSELGVRVIHANSPQAKGRVERLFRTLQDRLVKAMRLAGVRTLSEANRFLASFLTGYSRRFARVAREFGNLHRPAPAGDYLSRILCVKKPRVVANDWTIQIDSQHLQLLPSGPRSLAKRGVMVTISPQGVMRVLHEGREVRYRVLPAQMPPKLKPSRSGWPSVRRGHAQPQGHPWRQYERVQRLKNLKTGKFSNPVKPLEILRP